jgi:hypothetical protein
LKMLRTATINQQTEETMETISTWLYLTAVGAVMALTGCTGMEIGGKLWISRVDERQESQRTHNVPLKCYFWTDCTQPTEK